MGIEDRDYVRATPGRRWPSLGAGSVTMWLVILDAVFFVVLMTMANFGARAALAVYDHSVFTIRDGILGGQVWRLITFQFVHIGLISALAIILPLWFSGRIVEQHVGKIRFLVFYLVCGLGGAMTFSLLCAVHLLGGVDSKLSGAGAGMFGTLMAAAFLEPTRQVYVFFVQLTLKTFSWLLVVLAVVVILTDRRSTIDAIAFLGGGLLGWVWIRQKGPFGIMPYIRNVRGQRFKNWAPD